MRLISFAVMGSFCFLLFCKNQRNGSAAATTDALPMIPVDRDHVYDLSGYADEGAGNPYNLFDENAYVDPRDEKGGEPFIPVTNCQPTRHPAIYFGAKQGSRIVADLQVSYKIRDIYIYDRSVVNDSVWIYTGNMKRWTLKAAFETASGSGSQGWKHFSIDDSSQYVMIRFSSFETKITEMVLYGTAYSPLPVPLPAIPIKPFTSKPLKQFIGANYINETNPKWLKPFHYSRLYNFAVDYDNDMVHSYPHVQYNMLHYGNWNQGLNKYIFDIDTIKNINKGNVWYSIRGVSKWMSEKGYGDKDRPVNLPGMDPENPASYSRHAAMMWNMAAFFGNTKTDTSRMSLSHEPRQSGRGSFSMFENGNEEDAWWVGDKYCAPTVYFAQSSADYDGDEGRLGRDCGIVNADPKSKLMTSGMVELDTNRVKVYKFLSSTLRNDHDFIWKAGIQYHHYSNRNNKGISPEEDSLRWRLSVVRATTHRIQPDVDCFLGEHGYDKGDGSRQRTPILPGLSPSQSQGAMILRSINATFFSGFDAYILYWLNDRDPETSPLIYLTSGVLRVMPDGISVPYAGWYYISTMVSRLGDYTADSIISEKGNVWIYKYRNQLSPDSVAYFIYCPTVNGTKLQNYPLRIGTAFQHTVKEISMNDHSETGNSTAMKEVNGSVLLTIEETPKIILTRETK